MSTIRDLDDEAVRDGGMSPEYADSDMRERREALYRRIPTWDATDELF